MRPTFLLAPLAAALTSSLALASAFAGESFNRIATFNVVDNLPGDADPAGGTVAEIIAATEDGNLLVHTDSPGKRVGLIDIAAPDAPKPAGTVALDGEPTSVVVLKGKALVGVVTSESKDKPSGHLAVVDLASKSVVARCDLGGQPDSLAKSPDGGYLAIVIENERDEEVNDGAIPQLPSGNLTYFRLADGMPDCASMTVVELTGLADVAPEDAEPEYVDINGRNEAVVTLQENNHVAIVDLATGKVVSHFSAGAVDLVGIDATRDGVIAAIESKSGVLREPDAVQWVDDGRFVTANEGDWNGGSRGFTIFRKDGTVEFESGAAVDHQAIRLGHYPEKRAGKGSEPEGAEVATFGGERLIFIGAERASLVLVYRDGGAGAAPEYLQALPGGVGPEGLLAIPERSLLVSASETDLREDGLIGSVVSIYQRGEGVPAYPTIVSADGPEGAPIPWGALSGATADPAVPGRLYLVTDSVYKQARILTLDASTMPATITAATLLTRDGAAAKDLDSEGIALRPGGGYWIASEGNPEREENPTVNLLLRVAADGTVEESIELPAALTAGHIRFGLEGVTVTGSGAEETVWLAVQREWKDDPKGMAKLLAYRPADGSWGVVHYPLDKGEAGWVGLSELTASGEGLIVLERDNQIGAAAKIKQLTYVSLAGMTPAAPGAADIPVVEKTVLRDLLADLQAPKGYVLDKVESFAIDAAGDAYIITDNDGVDDASGETQLVRLGKLTLPM